MSLAYLRPTFVHAHAALPSPVMAALGARFTQTPRRNISVAACIIGDEILGGKTQDTNSRYLAKACFRRGVLLQKIETVRDDYSDIRNSVVGLSKTYDIVITSGGVGPTHDDITYDAVARAFGKSLEHHQPTLARMRDLMTRIMAKSRIEAVLPDPNGTPEQIACARMALIPQDSQVEFPSANLWVPLVTVNENVHVLPGVPKIFEQMVDDGLDGLIRRARDRRRARHQEEDQLPHESAASVMASRGEAVEDLRAQSFHRVLLSTVRYRESSLAPILSRIHDKYMPFGIKIGSYPIISSSKSVPNKVLISIVGMDREKISECQAEIQKSIDDTTIVEMEC